MGCWELRLVVEGKVGGSGVRAVVRERRVEFEWEKGTEREKEEILSRRAFQFMLCFFGLSFSAFKGRLCYVLIFSCSGRVSL